MHLLFPLLIIFRDNKGESPKGFPMYQRAREMDIPFSVSKAAPLPCPARIGQGLLCLFFSLSCRSTYEKGTPAFPHKASQVNLRGIIFRGHPFPSCGIDSGSTPGTLGKLSGIGHHLYRLARRDEIRLTWIVPSP